MVILKTFYLLKHPFFFKGVERWEMIGLGTKMMLSLFLFFLIEATWFRVKADVMCFHHNGNSLMFRA